MELGFYSSGVLEYEQTKAWSSRSTRPIRKETNGIGICSTGPFSLLIAQQHMKPTGPAATGPNRRPACIGVCVWHIYSVFIQIRWLPNHAISCRQVILRAETLWQLLLSNCEFQHFSTAPAPKPQEHTGETGIQKDTHICPGVMMDLKYCLHQQDACSHDAAFNYYDRSMLDGSRQHFQHYNKPFSALPLLFLKSKRRIGLE